MTGKQAKVVKAAYERWERIYAAGDFAACEDAFERLRKFEQRRYSEPPGTFVEQMAALEVER